MANPISKLQERDTCLALTFLMLLIWLFTRDEKCIFVGMGILLFGMVWSTGMRPFARVWFGCSILLGKIMSKVLLSLVYMLLVLPVALIRRLLGKDAMGLKQFGSTQQSSFVVREHTFVEDDLVHPY